MHARRALVPYAFTAIWIACLAAGLILMASFGYGMWKGVSDQNQLNQVWQQQQVQSPTARPTLDPSLKRPVGGIDFAIRVPKLHYFAAIREGVGTGVLYAGPGHYPATRWPGDPGTVGVAAHNVYWINFPELKSGDEIDLETRYGTYRYQVVSAEIVEPNNRTALVADAAGYNLALTTCWPLWAGAFATQRYVIHATQFSPSPPHTGAR